MARKRSLFEEPEDHRPTGSLLFADPSTVRMTERFNTFNEPHSASATGEQTGIRSIHQYGKYGVGGNPWADMNRKRGVTDDGE